MAFLKTKSLKTGRVIIINVDMVSTISEAHPSEATELENGLSAKITMADSKEPFIINNTVDEVVRMITLSTAQIFYAG